MRIVITGATGNVGSAVVRRLTANAAYEIVGVVRRPPDEAFADVQWVSADLTEDSAVRVLTETFEGADAVVHLVWGFQPSHDLRYLEELGVGGTRRVLQAVAGASVPHLVHMSSVGAYSPKQDDRPVDESWPTEGVPTSPYSRHKSAAERLLDAYLAEGHSTTITRMRPGIIGQRSAGSALLRYGVPGLVPAKVLDLVPALPLDRGLMIPMVHADDVADAIERALLAGVPGAFNLAANDPLTRDGIAEVLDARPVHVPAPVVRAVAAGAWHARLQQVDPGWIDLAFAVPLLDSSRASHELGWTPTKDAMAVFGEVVDGMRGTASDDTPVLRQRTVLGQLKDAVRRGPVSTRHRP
jgi:UDP-glucose 4-epimerase